MLELPPALFAGVRFLAAGALMFAYAWVRGGRLPAAPRDFATIALAAVLMLVGGNGLVTVAEQWIPSNQAALIVATSALWLAWVGTWGRHGDPLNLPTVLGLLLGFAGVAALVASGLNLRAAPVHAYLEILGAPVLWSLGTIWSRRRPVACAPAMNAALQMLVAGGVFTIIGLLLGDAARWRWTTGATLALVYLTLFGSCVAYGAYSWLVHEVPPARLGTYAYVNPAVAVVLGWWILDERLDAAQVLGTAIILAAVVLVTWASRAPRAVRA